MHHGHGDDLYHYAGVRINFSSNVYNHFDHQALYAHLAAHLDSIAHYPEPAPSRLEHEVADALELQPDEVMVCSGATEAIYLIAQAHHGAWSAVVEPTFAEYADACRMHGHRLTAVESLEDCLLTEWPDLLWLCNPNNPTGTVTSRDFLLAQIDAHPSTLFVVDASYAPFTDKPLLSPAEAVARHNVVLLHSMTKRFAVPGLRLGFLTASASVLGRLRELQLPWSVNSLAQEAARYLLAHEEDYPLPLDEILRETRRVARALRSYVDVLPTDSHMLLCRLRSGTAAELKEHLAKHHGILIRDASNFRGLTPAHFRIAVQTPRENDLLIEAIAKAAGQGFPDESLQGEDC